MHMFSFFFALQSATELACLDGTHYDVVVLHHLFVGPESCKTKLSLINLWLIVTETH